MGLQNLYISRQVGHNLPQNRVQWRQFVKKNRENMDLNVTVLESQCDSPNRNGGPSALGELVVWWWLRLVTNSGHEGLRMGTSGDEW